MNAGHTPIIWGVIPAAGIGSRMQSAIPKQYLELAGKTILQYSIERLLALDAVSGVIVALNPEDTWWQQLDIQSDKPVHTTRGGKERADSVLAALDYLRQNRLTDSGEDWVMVHDAVRPCVLADDMQRLIGKSLESDGGILASPAKDTIKRAGDDAEIIETLDRNHLWHAFTPQMFRTDDLYQALKAAAQQGLVVTDEASAMEHAGFRPRLVESRETNIKITRPDDLRMAEFILSEQQT